MKTSVLCTSTVSQAEVIVGKLKEAGFSSHAISVLFADKEGTRNFAISNSTKSPEGATVGAGTGAVVGGALGWLAGIGLLAIPGVGPFVAAGPIMAALGGVALGGAVGGMTGALIGMGFSELEAKEIETKIKAGMSLVSVHSENKEETARARQIFESAGASDVSVAREEALVSVDRV